MNNSKSYKRKIPRIKRDENETNNKLEEQLNANLTKSNSKIFLKADRLK